MKLFFIILRSFIYVALFIPAFGLIALNVQVFDRRIGAVLPFWTKPVGIIFMTAGAILVLICVAFFIIRGKGTPAVFDPPTKFVAIGPYAFVRNPMYIGGFILLFGFGLFRLSLSILILSVILIGLFHLFVVLVEEPTLEKQFGISYAEYKKHINRWKCKFYN